MDMSGPKRNPDKLNTIGVVVVGICGAVLVYVSIVALQAFYMNDTSEIQTMADYGGNDKTAQSIRTAQVHNITEAAKNATAPGKPDTYRISIDDAMRIVVEQAKVDPSTLVPSEGRADKPTIKPIFGRPQPLATPTPAPAPADGAGSAAGSGAAPADGAGSAAGSAAAPAPTPPAAPMVPTGGEGQGGSRPVGGGAGSSASGVPAPAVNLPKTTGTGPSAPKAPPSSGSGAGSGSAAKGNAP
jgi:cytoskeletal protein RodZ